MEYHVLNGDDDAHMNTGVGNTMRLGAFRTIVSPNHMCTVAIDVWGEVVDNVYGTVMVFGTYFLNQLVGKDLLVNSADGESYNFNNVRTHTNRIEERLGPRGNIFNLQKLFFPVISNGHYTLFCADVQARTLTHYNSLSNGVTSESTLRHFTYIIRFLNDEFQRRTDAPCPGHWQIVLSTVHSAPQQTNGNDCGPLVCAFMHLLAGNRSLHTIHPSQSTDFRGVIMASIIDGALHPWWPVDT
jgi:Ulp1 family protease